MTLQNSQYMVGLDVGSTTVKAIVAEAATDRILWRDYQRHETKQPEKTLEFLRRIETEVGVNTENSRIFMTGSGGTGLAELIGAKFVQEVTAVSLAVEKLHPEVYSVIELGGQDAKIIVFRNDDESSRKKKIPSMNDKCAGGTGAVIDKINAKLKIPPIDLCDQRYHGIKLHKVAGKCGVFAETDINGLQKVGTPSNELMASLFEAIVLQNLTVLTRGHTLLPHVLLLGGPNTFIRGMKEAWQANIPKMWHDRKVQLPDDADPEKLIKVPENAQYFAALGAIEFGKDEEAEVGRYVGVEKLLYYMDYGRAEEKAKAGGHGLVKTPAELEEFKEAYRRPKFVPATFPQGQAVRGFVGVDGGSTSTKAVLLSEEGEVLCKAYQLSNGNPIQDTIDMFDNLEGQVRAQGASLDVLGVGTTGYAKDILRDVLESRCRIGRNRGAYRVGAQVLRRSACHRRCRRTGHQADHSQKRARQGFQTEYSVLRRQWLLLAVHRRRVQPARGAICRQGLFCSGHAHVRIRLRCLHAVRHRQFSAAGLAG